MKIRQLGLSLGTLALSVSLMSCGGEKENAVEGMTSQPAAATHHAEPESADEASVKLNNGEPWQANAETTEAIQNMLRKVNAVSALPSKEEMFTLKKELTSEFQNLIDRCTMKGEAHEQLHHYIQPLQEYIGGLDKQQPEKSLPRLRAYLESYSKYFR